MPVRQIGTMPGGSSSSSSSTAAVKRVQGGRGLLSGDAANQVVRSLIVSGLLRGRNLDGVGGDPEVWPLPCDAVVADVTLNSRGGVQQFPIEADIFECDVFEVQFYGADTATQDALNAMQGGIYTEVPQTNGQPYTDTAIIPWSQSYATWGGGYSVLVLAPPIRRRLQPVNFVWIPQVQPTLAFDFKVRIRATCDWWQGSADPNPRVD